MTTTDHLKTCDHCGETFASVKPWARFCSDQCRLHAFRDEKRDAAARENAKRMTLTDYQTQTRRTWREHPTPLLALLHAVGGIAEEAGECMGVVKRHAHYGQPLDREHLVRELGDALWYLARTADELGVTLDHVAEVNLAKLRARYPGAGWTAEHARARLDGEDAKEGAER